MTHTLTNLVPSIPDNRDYLYIPPTGTWPKQPSVDLRSLTGRRLNQFVGSCTAEATVNACELLSARANVVDPLSRLFLYYNTRAIENRIGQEGAQVRNALRSALHHGICDDATWPNLRDKADVEPNDAAKAEALTQRMMRYERIYHWIEGPPLNHWRKIGIGIMSALAEGLPVVFALRLGQKFYDIKGPLERQNYSAVDASSNPYIGNHAICAVGYTGAPPYGLIYENSWGIAWGENGYGFMGWGVVASDILEAWPIRGFAGMKIRPVPGIVLRELTRTYLSVRIVPPAPVTTNIWVGAKIGDTLLLKQRDESWVPWDGVSYLPYRSNALIGDEIDVTAVNDTDNVDLAQYAGADIYVAYGADPMSWTLAKVCTIPAF